MGSMTGSIINAYGLWVTEYLDQGWSGYVITFIFDPLRGSTQGMALQMEKEVERVYAILVTRVVRKPRSDCKRDLIPRWFVCPDYPVPKHRKMDLAEVTVNHGRHMHGIGLMPPVSRMKEGLDRHFVRNQGLYVRDRGLLRVHAERITSRPGYVTGYAFKSLRRGRADFADLVILPRPKDQVPVRETWREELLPVEKPSLRW
jgi:hypothetical protein